MTSEDTRTARTTLCTTCDASGQLGPDCGTCRGTGHGAHPDTPCLACDGHGGPPCPDCNGKGVRPASLASRTVATRAQCARENAPSCPACGVQFHSLWRASVDALVRAVAIRRQQAGHPYAPRAFRREAERIMHRPGCLAVTAIGNASMVRLRTAQLKHQLLARQATRARDRLVEGATIPTGRHGWAAWQRQRRTNLRRGRPLEFVPGQLGTLASALVRVAGDLGLYGWEADMAPEFSGPDEEYIARSLRRVCLAHGYHPWYAAELIERQCGGYNGLRRVMGGQLADAVDLLPTEDERYAISVSLDDAREYREQVRAAAEYEG